MVKVKTESDVEVPTSADFDDLESRVSMLESGYSSAVGGVIAPHNALTIKPKTDSQIAITANALLLHKSTGAVKQVQDVDLTLDITQSGPGGLDAGSESPDTWYHLWVIAKEDGTVSGILSTSSTSPTMPSGYEYKGYVGASYNRAIGDFAEFLQRGVDVSIPMTSVVSGGMDTEYTPVDMSGVVPETATSIEFQAVFSTTSGTTTGAVAITEYGSGTTSGLNSQLLQFPGLGNAAFRAMFPHITISTPKTIYYRVAGTNVRTDLNVAGFRYV